VINREVTTTFYIRNAALRRHHHGKDQYWSDEMQQEPGWYYWSCFPGCLPDSEPMGPFASEQDALDDAQDDNDEEENV
jgi:hypothetical protein